MGPVDGTKSNRCQDRVDEQSEPGAEWPLKGDTSTVTARRDRLTRAWATPDTIVKAPTIIRTPACDVLLATDGSSRGDQSRRRKTVRPAVAEKEE